MAELDPAVATVLAEMAAAGLPPYIGMTPAEARRANAERNAFWNESPIPLADVRDLEVTGGPRPVNVRRYLPDKAARWSGTIVFVHGGGWLFGSIDTHDNIARRLALAAGRPVVSVDYALAPEQPWPAGLEDVLAVVRWLADDREVAAETRARIALAGDSAGANLALAACLALRDRAGPTPCAAALVYGAYSDDHESPSHAAYGDGRFVLTTAAMRWFWDHYAPEPAQRRDPLVAPLHADLRGLPPLFVTAAELDPLRDDSERLARCLIEAGVDLDWRLWRGMTHASLGWSRRVPRAARQIDDIGAFLARHLATR